MNIHEKSIAVSILGRDYPVRINHNNEAFIREIADYVDGRMLAYRKLLPQASEITVMAVASLAIAEELYTLKNEMAALEQSLQALEEPLDKVLRPMPDIQLVKIVP